MGDTLPHVHRRPALDGSECPGCLIREEELKALRGERDIAVAFVRTLNGEVDFITRGPYDEVLALIEAVGGKAVRDEHGDWHVEGLPHG